MEGRHGGVAVLCGRVRIDLVHSKQSSRARPHSHRCVAENLTRGYGV